MKHLDKSLVPQPQPPRWYEPALLVVTMPLTLLALCIKHVIDVATGHEFDSAKDESRRRVEIGDGSG